jgi:hypothetical protein
MSRNITTLNTIEPPKNVSEAHAAHDSWVSAIGSLTLSYLENAVDVRPETIPQAVHPAANALDIPAARGVDLLAAALGEKTFALYFLSNHCPA